MPGLLLIAIVLVVGSLGDLVYALCAGKLKNDRGLVALVFAGQLFVVGTSLFEYMEAVNPQDGKTWGAYQGGEMRGKATEQWIRNRCKPAIRRSSTTGTNLCARSP
jgi:hypothetical protein